MFREGGASATPDRPDKVRLIAGQVTGVGIGVWGGRDRVLLCPRVK